MKWRASMVLPVLLLAFLYAGYVFYPIARTVAESLHVGGEFSFGHYADLLDTSNRGNVEAVLNSVLVSLLSVVGSALAGVFLAFVFTQMEFPFRAFLSRLAIVPIALPPLVGVISFLFVFGETGIIPRLAQGVLGLGSVPFSLEGIPAIVGVHVYSFYVYFYLFSSTALQQIDSAVLEAAANLGGGAWTTFRRIILPELRPALAGASVLTFMASMASFTAPLIFAGEKRFVTLQIYTSKLNGEIDLAAAQAMLLTLVSAVFFVVLNRITNAKKSLRSIKGVRRSRPMSLRKPVRILLIASAMVFLAIVMLPMLTIVMISFAREGSWTTQVLPGAYAVSNYEKLVTDPHVVEPIWNSLIMSSITAAAALVFGVTGAYILTKGGLGKSKSVVDLLMNLPYAIPGTVVAVSLILAFNTPGLFSGYRVLVGTFWILPLAYVIRTYPLVLRSTAASLQQFDDTLLEAAQTFGATLWRRFRTIVLPIILPGIVSGCVLVMIAALGEFVSSILLYTYASRPISVEILSQLRALNFGAAAAYAVFLLMIILFLTLAANRITGRALRDAQRNLF